MTETQPTESEATAKVVVPWENPFPIDYALTAPDGNGGTVPRVMIHRAMFAARVGMPEIAKKGTMSLGGKDVAFTKIDDIKAALYPILDKHGIMVYIVIAGHESSVDHAEMAWTVGSKDVEPRPVRDGRLPSSRFREHVTVDIQFVFVGDNSGVVVRTIGEAMDTSSDKATNKATTAAVKRAFVETFGIVDHKEVDIEEENPEDKNRAVTTDRRQDRGEQQREAAQTGGRAARPSPVQRRSVTTDPKAALKAADEPAADAQTGEVPDEQAPDDGAPLPEPEASPETTKLQKEKDRIRVAAQALGYDPARVNAEMMALTGAKERGGQDGWLNKVTLLKKLADHFEKTIAENAGEGDPNAGDGL